MADRRRRRRRASQDSEEDDESGSGSETGRSASPGTKNRVREPEPAEAVPVARVVPKNDAESECESEDGVGEAVLSDYESADPEENGSHSEGGEEEEEAERYSDEEAPAAATESKPSAADGPTQGEEEQEQEQQGQEEQQLQQQEEEEGEEEERGGKEEGKADDKGNLEGERQSGDGQESTDDLETKSGGKPGQKLDDDEDRKNPAYIPRKGLFFEHDVRGQTQEEERPKGRNRKLWKDEGRWEHDRFREEEQAPKSREELIAIYGYDIRNGGGAGDRSYRQRRPRYSTSPSRDKRGGGGERGVERGVERGGERGVERGVERGGERGVERGGERGVERGERGGERGVERGGERPVRSWQSGGGGGGGERPVRSWQGPGGSARGPPSSAPLHPSSSSPSSLNPNAPPRSYNNSNPSNRAPPSHHAPPNRGFQSGRPQQNQAHLPPQSQYRSGESNAPHPRERQGPKTYSEPPYGHRQGVTMVDGERGGVNRARGGGGRGGPSVVVEEVTHIHGNEQEEGDEYSVGMATTSASQPGYQSTSPRRQQQQQQQQQQQREERGSADRSGLANSSCEPSSQSSTTNRESSPPTERPVERKSYSLARRTRSRPAELGSKQPSVEEAGTGGTPPTPAPPPAPTSGGVGGKNWVAGDTPSQAGGGGGGAGTGTSPGTGGSGLTGLDHDLARLSLAGQNWQTQGPAPTSYLRSEMRGIPSPMHMPGAPPQFSGMEEMGVGANRAKRYSSQRQRPVPEPAPPPMHPQHLGVMEGHYFEPLTYPGPIYAHGDSPAPIPPQGMLVQPEMHIPHPGLHPHPSGGPMANPALYGAPPVSLSPGQPQQLLAPPFYPPPGVMTFPYPAMYQPNPQAQSQVYGGVTYYDTMQQQAQPKPSPPRRSSQPVTVKPPPPEVPFASE